MTSHISFHDVWLFAGYWRLLKCVDRWPLQTIWIQMRIHTTRGLVWVKSVLTLKLWMSKYLDGKSIFLQFLTISPLNTTVVPYANSLDMDETPSNLVSNPDPSCLTPRQHFHQLWATLKHFENWSRREIQQTTIYLAG